MRSVLAILASASLFAIVATAAPGTQYNDKRDADPSWGNKKQPYYPKPPSHQPSCMSDSDAQKVANNFQQSIANYSTALALSAFTPDFHDYSDSVIELIDNGCTNDPVALGSATFSSRAAFMAGQGSQPAIPFKQLKLWHTCDAVTLRWVSSGPGQEPGQVTGIIVMETEFANNTWLINTVYSEFNSGAWLVNLGIFVPKNCTAS